MSIRKKNMWLSELMSGIRVLFSLVTGMMFGKHIMVPSWHLYNLIRRDWNCLPDLFMTQDYPAPDNNGVLYHPYIALLSKQCTPASETYIKIRLMIWSVSSQNDLNAIFENLKVSPPQYDTKQFLPNNTSSLITY